MTFNIAPSPHLTYNTRSDTGSGDSAVKRGADATDGLRPFASSARTDGKPLSCGATYRDNTMQITIPQIVDAVASVYGVEPHSIRGRSRLKKNAEARCVVVGIVAKLRSDLDRGQIGKELGGRERWTIRNIQDTYARQEGRHKDRVRLVLANLLSQTQNETPEAEAYASMKRMATQESANVATQERQKPQNTATRHDLITKALTGKDGMTSAELVEETGVTRQGCDTTLRTKVDRGEVKVVGTRKVGVHNVKVYALANKEDA